MLDMIHDMARTLHALCHLTRRPLFLYHRDHNHLHDHVTSTSTSTITNLVSRSYHSIGRTMQPWSLTFPHDNCHLWPDGSGSLRHINKRTCLGCSGPCNVGCEDVGASRARRLSGIGNSRSSWLRSWLDWVGGRHSETIHIQGISALTLSIMLWPPVGPVRLNMTHDSPYGVVHTP
jgi:hypothetical protein